MKRFSLLTVLSVLLLFTFLKPAFAQDSLNVRTVASLYDFWTFPNGIATQGDTAYITTRSSGLRVVDISDPENPVEIASNPWINRKQAIYEESESRGLSLDVANNHLYIADRQGIRVVDITDINDMQVVGDYGDSLEAVDLIVEDTLAYVHRAMGKGLRILNVSDPEHVTEVGRYDMDSEIRTDIFMEKSGNLVYLTHSRDSLSVLDVSDPQDPQFVKSIGNINTNDFIVKEGLLICVQDSLTIYDVSDLDSVKLIGSLSRVRYSQMFMEGDLLYLAGSFIGIVDISDPDDPILVGDYETEGPFLEAVNGIIKRGNFIFAVDIFDNLAVLNVENPEDIYEIIRFPEAAYITNVQIKDDLIYLIDKDNGLRIAGWDEDDNFQELSLTPLPRQIYEKHFQDMAVKDDIVYLCMEKSGFIIIDATEPENPVQVSQIDSVGAAYAVEGTLGDYAYVLFDGAEYPYYDDRGVRIEVFDISDPANPLSVDYHEFEEIFYSIHRGYLSFQGNKLYSYLDQPFGRLQVFDASDPESLELIAKKKIRSSGGGVIAGMTVQAGRAYLTGSVFGTYLYDVSDLDSIRGLDFWRNAEFMAISADGQFMVTRNDFSNPISLEVNRITAANNYYMTGYVELPGSIENAQIVGDRVYVAGLSNLSVYNIADALTVKSVETHLPFETTLLTAYPNPFNSSTRISYTVPTPGMVTLKLFDVQGREVALLTSREQKAGRYDYTLDGTNLPAGIYFLNLTNGDRTIFGR